MGFQGMSYKEVETVKFESGVDLKEQFLESSLNTVTELAAIKNTATKTEIHNRFAIYNGKTGHHYGIVSDKYGIVQNDVVFELFETMCDELDMKPKNMVISNGGAQVALFSETPDLIKTPDGKEDIIKQIVIKNSHNGWGGLTVNMNVVRQICTNGMIGLVADKDSSFKITHTQAIHRKFNEIIGHSKIFNKAFDKYQNNVRMLAQKQVDRKLVEDFLLDCVSSSKKSDERDLVENLFERGKGNNGETAYDLINGYYEYLDNSEKSNQMNDLFGPIGAKKKKAFDWLMKVA